jgi:N-acetylmuramoyl-L-alanine amidase/putative methionine-R-sulfoxide reductase with GAF domain
MVTTPIKPGLEEDAVLVRVPVPSWPPAASEEPTFSAKDTTPQRRELRPFGADALQALLAFSALHQQVRQRRALAARSKNFDAANPTGLETEFEIEEQFVLDEVLQLVADRAIAITGADGLGIALAENNEIVLRASSGTIKPDVGARIQRDSAFSGACFRTAQIIRCDDTETDDRVNLYACRQLGARSMVAVPLCGHRRVIGLLEAFSAEPFGFNDSDVTSLELLAELIVGAIKPEDEDRFAESAQAAEEQLEKASEAAPPVILSAVTASQSEAVTKSKDQISAVPTTDSPRTSHRNIPSTELLADKHPTALELSPAAQTAPESEDVQSTPEISPSTNRHPGIMLVLALVVLAALLGAGLWWKLNNAQLGGMSLKSSEQMPSKELEAKQSAAPTTLSSPAATSSSLSAPSATSDRTDTSVDQVADDSNASARTDQAPTSQELSKMPHITGIRHWSSADSSTVVLDLEDQVQYEAHRLANPDRIYFDLHDTSLSADFVGKTIDVGDGLLARVRVAQPVSGLTRIVLETKGNSNYSVSLEPNPYRLVVQVRKPGADSKSQINLFPGAEEAAKRAIVVPPPTKEDLQLRAHIAKLRIVVDAGHGGWDLGTVGRRGLLEKDLVLEIAQRLGKLLESRLGADVILTRNDDNYIPLDERAGMANQAQADLFVSVHANYSDLPSARGVETYYTNFFSAPSAKDLETRAVSTGNAPTATLAPAALSPSELHDKIEQSRRLAASVQRSLYGTLSTQNPGLRDRGVKEASYVVLTETAMPGILAEVSFVSSPTDEQKLRSDGYREQIAEALYKGIARYAAARSVKVASVKQ